MSVRLQGGPCGPSHLLSPAHSGSRAAHAPLQPSSLARTPAAPCVATVAKKPPSASSMAGPRARTTSRPTSGNICWYNPHHQTKKGRHTTRIDRTGAGRIEEIPQGSIEPQTAGQGEKAVRQPIYQLDDRAGGSYWEDL